MQEMKIKKPSSRGEELPSSTGILRWDFRFDTKFLLQPTSKNAEHPY
jgi:hypothetical protein